jgi:hypothetical protein
MKIIKSRMFKPFAATFVSVVVACLPAFATTTFTSNTTIVQGNTNYDGTDIVVSNCTLTVDGPHTFSSLHVEAGGVLTHSFNTNGSLSGQIFITNESQILSGTNQATLDNPNVILASIAVTDSTGLTNYTNGLDYLESTNGILTQLQRTTNSSIPDGATVLVGYEVSVPTASAGLYLTITGNVTVDVAGAINANGGGYGGGNGTGAGSHSAGGYLQDGSGGGYGGNGGNSSSNALGGGAYGAYSQSVNLGSGGGAGYGGLGGAGGGVIDIVAGGGMTVNGVVSANGANGTNSRSGGGSGGTIALTVLSFSGSGTITANGGSGDPIHGGGGGGGRVEVQYSSPGFAGSMTAYGGSGANIGGAGTVYTLVTGPNTELLLLDNGGQPSTNTPLSVQDGNLNVVIQGDAGVTPTNSWTVGNLTIASNGLLLASSTGTITLTSAGAITIEAGGVMSATGAGYGPGIGNGAGRSYNDGVFFPCGGGGYGGNGANSIAINGYVGAGGASYGVQSNPSGFGGGGGTLTPYSFGGASGGYIRIISSSGIVDVEGTLSANGSNGSGSGGGGGSGGTISVTGGTLLGAGSITANGGNGANSIGGGGGGGRVFLNPTANLLSGTISAYGGLGANVGGAGTVVIQVTGQNTQLILDNGGNFGTNTLVQSASSTDLIVRGGAVGSASSPASFVNLFLNTNGWLVPYSVSAPATAITFTFTGNATVQAGGGIVADFAGYPAQQGPGEGRAGELISTNLCSGAGHGGLGGNSFGNVALGGSTYDSATSPAAAGSGGGAISGQSFGGNGGGIIRLAVTGTLEVEGIITANGGGGSGLAGGGGSGGSIWLSAATLSGAGSIAANGGSGADGLGGGGGGGMAYISCTANSFSGGLTAYGGGGANWGGAGTAIIQVSGKNALLTLDDGGHPGAPTPLPSSSTTDVTLRNGAVGLSGSSVSLGNVLVSSNASLLMSNSPSYSSSMSCASLTIQAGGSVNADFVGGLAIVGIGTGHNYAISPYYPCGGAGHGGNGGNSISNLAAGGIAYDSVTTPSQSGSLGGAYLPYSVGGPGGGVFSLTVNGLLQNDGNISANGGNGSGAGGGGGSGGGFKITAGTLSGAGTIAANGGAGANSIGGGGGGGYLAIYPTANLFTGTISAYGGSGATAGGAGSIYIQNSAQSPQYILDNGGQAGALTPIQSISSSTALILRNAALGYPQSSAESFLSLLVSSNAFLVVSNSAGAVTLTFTGSATVQAGCGIVADNAGAAPGVGSGPGHFSSVSPSYPCSGAGYGGYGANSSGNLATGGAPYGSITSPSSIGSGGGSITPHSLGGAGGGAMHLTVNGTLDAVGRISANGGNGSGLGGGGGSGGSIWLTVGTLAGAGSITANGGSGANSVGGGGAGGRISIAYTANDFLGSMTAYGGGGYAHGAAGTIYTKANSQAVGQLTLDNGGAAGTNTPLSSLFGIPSSPFNLTVGDGAIVSSSPQTSLPQLNNLIVAPGGLLTVLSGQSTLDLLVFSNIDVQQGGGIVVDGDGYSQGIGPGAGQSSGQDGSGAGYGGAGGASGAIAGGASYGSSNQPVNFGSGGGFGYGTIVGGSQGGGAVRLSVGGTLTVDGQISAQGEPGLQDNSGGGSGGSILATAGSLAGSGLVTVNGGEGELYGGGGGAGGRIALYSRASAFFGQTTASGALGDSPGANGTIYSNPLPTLQVLSNSPSGIVSNGVTSVLLYFNDAPNPNSFPASAVSLMTPNGPLPSNSITILMSNSASYYVIFPLQTAVGNYTLTVGPNINDLYGQPMGQAYTGSFTISLPVIQGTITDTNGQPVAGVLLQPTAGLSSTTTDTNGNYALGFTAGSSFTVTPSLGTLVFLPPSLSYSNISTSISNQNFLAFSSIAPVLAAAGNGTNLAINWQGLPGINYQVYSSPDLTNWLPYGSPFTGTNGPIQILVPIGGGPAQFFTVQASN